MENELTIDIQKIIVKQGSIKFNEYTALKDQAMALAENIKTITVSDENIKQSKKLLAAVNKRLKELEDKRIEVKKTMLEPYAAFEKQVKEIVGIVKDADSEVRDQVRYLEECYRLQKEGHLRMIFSKRKKHYILGDIVPFEHFLKPQHLNKSVSMDQVEKEMTAFLEKTSADFKVIESLPDAKAVLSAYIGFYDLAAAINQIEDQKRRQKQLEASKAMQKAKAAAVKKLYRISLYNEKDFTLLKMFMEQQQIKYDLENVEVV